MATHITEGHVYGIYVGDSSYATKKVTCDLPPPHGFAQAAEAGGSGGTTVKTLTLANDGTNYISITHPNAMAFEFNPFTGNFDSVGLSQASADARYVLRANNLSDLASAATARTNLGVYSKAESDAAGAAGNVGFTARATAPTGWLVANGAAVSRSVYATLFSAIGTAYGVGDGSTTFNLPDGRGVFFRGLDGGRGLDSGRTIGSFQSDALASHTHDIAGVRSFNISLDNVLGGVVPPNAGIGSTYSVTTTAFGGVETRPKNIAFLPIIKF